MTMITKTTMIIDETITKENIVDRPRFNYKPPFCDQ